MIQRYNQLGVIPIAAVGGKLGVDAILGLASSILPGLLKSKYAESDAAIKQVNAMAQSSAGSLAEVNQLTSQLQTAFGQTTSAIQAKTAELRKIPSSNSDNGTIKKVAIATGITVLTTIAINKFL